MTQIHCSSRLLHDVLSEVLARHQLGAAAMLGAASACHILVAPGAAGTEAAITAPLLSIRLAQGVRSGVLVLGAEVPARFLAVPLQAQLVRLGACLYERMPVPVDRLRQRLQELGRMESPAPDDLRRALRDSLAPTEVRSLGDATSRRLGTLLHDCRNSSRLFSLRVEEAARRDRHLSPGDLEEARADLQSARAENRLVSGSIAMRFEETMAMDLSGVTEQLHLAELYRRVGESTRGVTEIALANLSASQSACRAILDFLSHRDTLLGGLETLALRVRRRAVK